MATQFGVRVGTLIAEATKPAYPAAIPCRATVEDLAARLQEVSKNKAAAVVDDFGDELPMGLDQTALIWNLLQGTLP